MKKIILSLAVIGVVGAIVAGATIAYYTDTEVSRGNVLTAGSIDLKIDNDAWFNGEPMAELSWTLDDLTDHLFFNYTDLKPGDWEEDTISIHVDNNDAWVCGEIVITRNDDMTCTEPELKDNADPTCDEGATPPDADIWDGDLAQELKFIYWIDDGDNVLEDDEYCHGPISPYSLIPDGGIKFPIADASYSIAGFDANGKGLPLDGSTTYYIGKAFCFGIIDILPVEQDRVGNVRNPGGAQGPGFTCSGKLVSNAAQTDSVMGDISFTAIQSRNNANYLCIGCQSDAECDDDNPCTDDVCGDNGVCENTCLTGDSCVDGDDYTINDKCVQDGDSCICVGTPVECIDNAECVDDNECTLDICGPDGACHNTCVTNQLCDDDNIYTMGDICTQVGDDCICVGTPECTVHGDCNDGNICTDDTCDANGVCQNTCLVGTSCNDGIRLTINDVCTDVTDCPCAGTPVDCLDASDCVNGPACTTAACVANVCEYTPICDGSDTQCGCTSCRNCNEEDGWVDIGDPYPCCQGTYQLCTCQDQHYIDYSCIGTSCVSAITDWQTVGTNCNSCYPLCCINAQCQTCPN